MVLGVDQLRRGTEVLDPAESLRLKIAFGTEICTIASGPNAIANLLDLTILVSVSRRTVEEHWQPQAFGESARPMLESCRQAETGTFGSLQGECSSLSNRRNRARR